MKPSATSDRRLIIDFACFISGLYLSANHHYHGQPSRLAIVKRDEYFDEFSTTTFGPSHEEIVDSFVDDSTTEKPEKYFMVVAVFSVASHAEQRNVMRSTWLGENITRTLSITQRSVIDIGFSCLSKFIEIVSMQILRWHQRSQSVQVGNFEVGELITRRLSVPTRSERRLLCTDGKAGGYFSTRELKF